MRARRVLWASFGVLTGLGVLLLVWSVRPFFRPPVNPQDIRTEAWARIGPQLDAADQFEEKDIEQSIEVLNNFFKERKAGTREFAKAVLSLKGQWSVIRGKIARDNADRHFLQENFEAHVFKPDELKQALESSVGNYATGAQRDERQLLFAVRANLSNLPAVEAAIPALKPGAVFEREYQAMLTQVSQDIVGAIEVHFARKVGSQVVEKVLTEIATRVLVAVAVRLAVSTGIVSAEVAASYATLGAALIATVVLDIALDWLLSRTGHDPEAQVADKVNGTLEHVRLLLVDGDPDAREHYAQLRKLEREAPHPEVRAACKKAADSIEWSGNLGLRHALKKVHEARVRARREALRRLVLDGGSS